MQRIVALLFALADMADWAATAPHPARVRMLILLRIAEPAARSVTFTSTYRSAGAACENDSPATAVQLAARLRMLACMALYLLLLPNPAERSSAHPPVKLPAAPRRLTALARLYLDTS